jgi:anti-sigma-K factor RskA
VDLSCIIQSGDLELYVMGMLPPEEAGKVEVLAQLFPEIQQEIDAIAATFEAGAKQMAVTPSLSLKEKLMAALPAKNETSVEAVPAKIVEMKPEELKKTALGKLAVAASWILLVLFGWLSVYFFNQNNQLKSSVVTLQQNTAGYEEQMSTLNKKLNAYETYRRLKNDASITAVALTSMQEGVKQQAEIFWNKTTGEVFIDPSLLPKAPAGKQYQLWFILDGKPIDAGMITLTDDDFIHKMKECKAAQAFAITLEKEGGNPTPQGQMMVLGKVS